MYYTQYFSQELPIIYTTFSTYENMYYTQYFSQELSIIYTVFSTYENMYYTQYFSQELPDHVRYLTPLAQVMGVWPRSHARNSGLLQHITL